ncbi:HES6 protein, partial [Dicaeum eximium]|nr:HES6 protein [Dicaeum eximium]
QTRKPLVEKKRRARINESLRELRLLLADSEVRQRRGGARAGGAQGRADGRGAPAHERFAAGYIQCMHEVHTFVSSCPGIDATTAAELLNHLLESMPLSEGGCPDSITDVLGEPALGPWLAGEALALPAGARPGLALPAPALSPCPSEETCSDSDEAEAETGQTSTDGLDASQTRGLPSPGSPKSMWRPW